MQLVGNGCALRHCRRVPLQSEVRQRRKEEKDSLPFSREFGWYDSNPSSTLQCVDGYKPVFWAALVPGSGAPVNVRLPFDEGLH